MMNKQPDSLASVHAALGASLLTLSERGELKAGDGNRLLSEAREQAQRAAQVAARRQLTVVMRQLAMRLHAAGAMYGEESEGWEAEAKAGLQRIAELAKDAGLYPKCGDVE